MTMPNGRTPKTARRMTDERDRALYAISVAAELAGVHPQTLRMYERRGLIRPQRTDGKTRRYSQRDVEEVLIIQELTQTHGMNLAGVARVLEMSRELEDLRAEVDRMRDEVARGRRAARVEMVLLREAKASFDPETFKAKN